MQFLLGLVGYGLICNFPATYLFLPVAALLLYLVVRLEEKELRDRFGEEYAAYCRRVPRFFPKRRKQMRPVEGGTDRDVVPGR